MKKRFLFIHQNFPGQFVHAVTELVRRGHEVVALGIKGRAIEGVEYLRYLPRAPTRESEVEPARDFEVKVVRGLACAEVMQQLRARGFQPDVIVAHPGWGEALFCKDVWPRSRLIVFAEFYYSAEGADFGFDPEFSQDSVEARARLRLKNSVHLHAMQTADAIYTPTEWQRSQIPPEFRDKVQVIFDGIDTRLVAPDASAFIELKREKLRLGSSQQVITFVNRNLEPYRGFHTFMRALPEILRQRPQAHCLIVGRDEVSYGARPKGGGNWREAMMRELGAELPADRVHFLGGLPYLDYLRVLQISSCHVYLTYPFVLSWSCLEAMAAGKLVVGSRTAPVEEVIEHGRNGLLVDFFDLRGLVRQVVEVLSDQERFAALGERARQTVVERYDLATRCLPKQLALLGG